MLFISLKHLDNIGLKFLFWMKITKNDLTMLLKFLSFLNATNVKNYINNNNNNNHLILLIKFIEKKKLILFKKNRKILNNIK